MIERLQRAEIQYQSLLDKMKANHVADDENSLAKEIKNLDKEINHTQAEIDSYKRDMDFLKNKIEFKMNLEKSINIEGLVRNEKAKNKELVKEYESLVKQNSGQRKVLELYDKETGFPDKIELLKGEIKYLKDGVKDYLDKNNKQERYIKQVHEKINLLENQIRKLNNPKIEYNKKSFTQKELNDSIDTINYLKTVINECKLKLKNNVKTNEEKLASYISLNKKIEADYKENERVSIKLTIFLVK